MYLMSRHFVWLVPLSNLLLFFVVGMFLAVATKLWPRPAGWLSPRLSVRLPYAGFHGGGPSNLPVGLVGPGVGNRHARGPVARTAGAQVAAMG